MEYRKGNLFNAEDGVAIAHGCNCQGVMGAGIALQFKNRYPEMFEWYKFKCQHKDFSPGDAFVWKGKNYIGRVEDRYILNLATQDRPGPYARLEWIDQSLRSAIKTFGEAVPTIAMPNIGCGIGGLDWEDVEVVLETLEKSSNVKFIVYSL